MNSSPTFFIPNSDPASYESVFAEYAARFGRPIPMLPERVYSIVFEHNGEEWTATVGAKLQGIRRGRPKKRSFSPSKETFLSDSATVLAIFPGNPYLVVTDQRNPTEVRSAWENPFLAGSPSATRRFAVTA